MVGRHVSPAGLGGYVRLPLICSLLLSLFPFPLFRFIPEWCPAAGLAIHCRFLLFRTIDGCFPADLFLRLLGDLSGLCRQGSAILRFLHPLDRVYAHELRVRINRLRHQVVS
jgi:hypothetical protein